MGISEIDLTQIDFGPEFDMHYGLVAPEQTVLVRAFSDDTDEQLLAEIQPRYIIMFEPNLDFVRRIEVGENHRFSSLYLTFLCIKVYKKANPGLAVRIYLLIYNNSCEEAKYLAGVRREKESFERLIKERGVRLLLRGRLMDMAMLTEFI